MIFLHQKQPLQEDLFLSRSALRIPVQNVLKGPNLLYLLSQRKQLENDLFLLILFAVPTENLIIETNLTRCFCRH